MCNPISGILKSDGTIFMPAADGWNHSHSAIAKANGIPDGEWGDRYARFEVTPAGYSPDTRDGLLVFRDKETNAVRTDVENWNFKLDEERKPTWFKDDEPALIDKCRQAALKWIKACPDSVVPGGRSTAGYAGQATAGARGQATAGDEGQATAGYAGQATAGYEGQATAGYEGVILLAFWDGKRRRIKVVYIGEDGFKPGVKYRWDDAQKKVVEA